MRYPIGQYKGPTNPETFCDNLISRFRPGRKEACRTGPKTFGDRDSEMERGSERLMTDAVNFLMLIAASIGSMAFGVLAAYATLRAGLALMRPEGRRPMLKARTRVAGI